MTDTTDNSAEDFFLIGTIVAPFGIKGQVKMRSITDQPEHVNRHIKTVYLGPKYTAYRLVRSFEHKPGLLILAFDGVVTRTAAEGFRNLEVYIPEAKAAPLREGEYYLHQLYGLHVFTTDGQEIGKVRDVLETGANEVLVIARPNEPDALVPLVHDIVDSLDFDAARIVIRPMEGLL